MNTYFLDLRFIVSGYSTEDVLEAHLERVIDHLSDLDGVVDPDLTARLSSGDVVFSLGVEAEDGPHALSAALVLVRTAIHACDGSTAGWESDFREVEQTIRPAELMEA